MNLWFTWTSSVICFLQTKANALLFCNLFAELRHFFPFRQRREQSLAIKKQIKKAASFMWAEVLTASSLNDSFLIYILKGIKCVYVSFVFFYDLFTYQSKQKRWWWENDVTFLRIKKYAFWQTDFQGTRLSPLSLQTCVFVCAADYDKNTEI